MMWIPAAACGLFMCALLIAGVAPRDSIQRSVALIVIAGLFIVPLAVLIRLAEEMSR